MLKDGMITVGDAKEAISAPLITRKRQETEYVTAEYLAEEVRRQLVKKYGERRLYQDGLVVRATLDPQYQKISDEALRNGLLAYDKRHGWRARQPCRLSYANKPLRSASSEIF